MTETVHSPVAVLQNAIESWNRGDLTGYLALYADGITLHGMPEKYGPGLAGVRSYYEAIWKMFPGSTLILEDVVGEGSKVAARYTMRAVRADSDKQVEGHGMTILHFSGGKCVERWDLEGG